MFRYFENLIDPYPPEEPQQPPNNLYQFCRHYTRGMERPLILMAVLTAATAIGEALLYGILGQIVDWLSNATPESFLQEQWPRLLGMGVLILVLIPVAVAFQSTLLHQTLMGNFPMLVRWKSHRYLLRQSYSFFQQEFSGRIATKVMQTAIAVRQSVIQLLDVMLFVSVYMVTMLVLVAAADWRLCIPVVFWLCGYVGVLRFFVPRLRDISAKQADARSLMTGRIVDSYTNMLTLKLFSHSQRESDYAKQGMKGFMETVHPQMRLVTLLNISVWSLNMLLVFTVGAVGIWLWIDAAVTAGAIAIAFSLAIRLSGMSHWVMWEVSALFENFGTAIDGMNTLSQPNSVADKQGAIELMPGSGQIDFSAVDFAYNKNNTVFTDFDLSIAAGEKVGFVGRSGAGKSTLVNLLLRLYDADDGSVKINGQDIKQVTQDSLRKNIAMVTQDTSLLHRSVRDNILFGRPDASEEDMVAAARQAEAHDFIMTLSDNNGRRGYDAHVGERGVTLSGGQRQRIAIARVLLKDAPILVLDEATSALDSEVEADIQRSLYTLMQGKTVIAIAHRLSTIAAMDRLIVLDQGRIVEQGTHSELLANGGLYAQLWQHQSGGFLLDDW